MYDENNRFVSCYIVIATCQNQNSISYFMPSYISVQRFNKNRSLQLTKQSSHFNCSTVFSDIFSLGGLDLYRSCLDQDSRSQHWQRAALDSRENLDTFKILVSTSKKSQLRSRYLDLVSMAICKSSTSRSRSRLIKTCGDFCDY
jgi:hypothetical protein